MSEAQDIFSEEENIIKLSEFENKSEYKTKTKQKVLKFWEKKF
jgi:hypothetical protein